MTAWSEDDVRNILQSKDWLDSERDIDHGRQFLLKDGTKVNCFGTGRVSVQGKASTIKDEAMELFGKEPPPSRLEGQTPQDKSNASTSPKRVFIVYGHDATAREQLEHTLMQLKLEPVVLQNMAGGGDTIIEKLDQLKKTDYACVLLTPDDEGRKQDSSGKLKPRARQNVILELGMVLAHLGRRRVAILVKGSLIERPSDIDGLIYISFSKHVKEAKNMLAANLQDVGFEINVKDLL